MPSKRNYDQNAILADLRQGRLPMTKIGKKHGVSEKTVRKVAKRAGIQHYRADSFLERDFHDGEKWEKKITEEWNRAVEPLRRAKYEKEMRYIRANRLDIGDLRGR